MKKLNLKYIKERRLDLNLTLQHLANSLGYSNASTYLKYENGDYSFRAEMLPILCEVLEEENIENFFK